ncbi:MAG: phosphoribosylanthranilate isomerase [Clostridia bacterium]|nr:phosphoribosylanthranilate isomerase [Clostridia bacterium]
MTRIKMCGLRRREDIDAANELLPEYIGFVFFPGSKRAISAETARDLKNGLSPAIQAVGVFVDEKPETVASLLEEGTIDIAQFHGHEDESYLNRLRSLTGKPVIQAFRIRNAGDMDPAQASGADMILMDAGAGDGKTFDWNLLHSVGRPYFLAGGLNPENVGRAVKQLKPYAVDVSSGIETDGFKDVEKMRAFLRAVRERG